MRLHYYCNFVIKSKKQGDGAVGARDLGEGVDTICMVPHFNLILFYCIK